MSEKLYLIRVDMERFIGPMTLREVRESYRRMEFGLQDEIAASNRAWVAFDDLDRIKRYYPELIGLIKREMLSGWGSTNPSSIKIRRDPQETSISRKTVSLFTKVSILLGVSFISFVVFYLVRENRISDISLLFKDPLMSQAIFLYGDDYNVRFEAFMDRNREDINKALKNRQQLDSWLPYIRAIAFQRDGTWPGLAARALRGKDMEYTPKDCSLASWKKRWDASSGQWQSLLTGASFPAADWAKVLVWDSDWIRFRVAQERHWLSPRNYYEACMMMALKALNEAGSNKDRVEAEVFRSRLKWKLNLLSGEISDTQFQMSGSLWALSCIESAEHVDEVKNCTSSMKLGREWVKFMENRMHLREARMIISENSVIGREQIERLRFLLDKLPNVDPFTRFDYTEEKKLFQIVIDKSGQVAAAIHTVNQQSQLYRFDY